MWIPTTLIAIAIVTCIPTVGCIHNDRVLETYEDHPCIRKCIRGVTMTCIYNFTLEYYFTLAKACYDCPLNKTDCFRPHCVTADGVPRAIIVVNRMLPGPGLHVCEGDTIVVRVTNELTGSEGTSIHWHGVHQRGTPYMDGVGQLTQCPIPIRTTFEYRFKVDNPGTHFWHAHSGLQRSDGLFGALVVRQPDEYEPHLGLYEQDLPEHTMLVHDWLVELSINRFAHHHYAGGDNKPRSMLVNGKGVLQEFFDNTDNTTSYTPVEVYHVTQGTRYRFRTISNGILNCPIQVSIDNHTLTMIASDGNAFEKVDVESFNIFAGERFDFVLNASMPVGNYWVRVRGLADCGVKQAKQVAILRYDGAPDEDPVGTITWEDADRKGKKLNPWNKAGTENLIQVADLVNRLPEGMMPQFNATPDRKFYLAMDFNKIDNFLFHDAAYYPISAVARPKHLYMPQINHITTLLPPSPPLTQLKDLDKDMFCNPETMAGKNCSDEFCACVYSVKVPLGADVEFVFIDEGVTFNANHPMHLHGYSFYVVGMEKLNDSTSLEEIKSLDDAGLLERNLTHAVAKDTVTVPDGGYTIVRIIADNPGFWFLHCHIEFHSDIGMGLFLQVGDTDDLPPIPRRFPKCGSWAGSPDDKDAYEAVDETGSRCTGGTSRLSSAFSLVAMIVFAMVLL